MSASDEFRADVLIVDERISCVGTDIDAEGADVVDAGGAYVIPGGIDTHTHFEHIVASRATRTADDFASGSVAAAVGGTTSVVDFVRAPVGTGIEQAFLERRERAESAMAVDFGLHPMVPSWAGEDDSFDQLSRLAERDGAASWKFFMAYAGSMVDDGVLLRGFRRCAELGVLPMVHAENGHMVADATERLVASGRTAVEDHVHAHPADSEAEAVDRAIRLARQAGTPLFIVHVSAAEAIEVLRDHQRAGASVVAETCPQYLVAASDAPEVRGALAAGYVCSPPIRERANQEPLWRAVQDGTISTIGTDHAAFTLGEQPDLPPQKGAGGGDFTRTPNGVPGVEERLMVMHHHGVVARGMRMTRFVELTSAAPARTFGLTGKGAIVPGSDADIVIWDPDATRVLRAATLHSRSDYCVYEGLEVTGVPRVVLGRGTTLAVDGEPTGALPGRGRYLRRSRRAPHTTSTRSGT